MRWTRTLIRGIDSAIGNGAQSTPRLKDGQRGRWLNNMKTKLIVALAMGVLIGLIIPHILAIDCGTQSHWRAVLAYNAYMRNLSNAKPDRDSNLSSNHPPIDDPGPHLAALVAAGEIEHLDIVLPTVRQDSNITKHWRAFCEAHPDEIVYATGNHSWTAFTPEGEQPTHLNLWFKASAQPLVQQLIQELQEMN